MGTQHAPPVQRLPALGDGQGAGQLLTGARANRRECRSHSPQSRAAVILRSYSTTLFSQHASVPRSEGSLCGAQVDGLTHDRSGSNMQASCARPGTSSQSRHRPQNRPYLLHPAPAPARSRPRAANRRRARPDEQPRKLAALVKVADEPPLSSYPLICPRLIHPRATIHSPRQWSPSHYDCTETRKRSAPNWPAPHRPPDSDRPHPHLGTAHPHAGV